MYLNISQCVDVLFLNPNFYLFYIQYYCILFISIWWLLNIVKIDPAQLSPWTAVPFQEGTPLWDIPHIETATVGYHSVALKACQIFRQQIPSAFAGLKEWGTGLIFCHRIRKVFSFATFPTRTIDRPFGLNILCKFSM